MNYGDSLIENTDVFLESDNTIGIQVMGPVSSSKRMNNMLLSRVEIIARDGRKKPGMVGIHLRNIARITLLNVDIEQMDIGINHESAVAGGPITHLFKFILWVVTPTMLSRERHRRDNWYWVGMVSSPTSNNSQGPLLLPVIR